MHIYIRLALFTCLLATTVAVVQAPPSQAGGGDRVTLERPRPKPGAVVLTGRAARGAKVHIVRKSDHGWKRVATDRTGRRGRFHVRLARPARSPWVVRAVSGGTTSPKRTVTTRAVAQDPAPTTVESRPSTNVKAPTDACGTRSQKSDGTWWECTFVDNFDGSTLDLSKWQAQDTSLTGISNGPACFIGNKPSAIAVAKGVLRLTSHRVAEPFTCRSPYGDFVTDLVSATVTTKGRFNQAYGRFSFRAKLPTVRVPGAHSALWLYPDRHTYGKWPYSGEIDVAEWYSALPEWVYPSVHYVDGLRNVHTGRNGHFEDVSAWHTYELQWTPAAMRFFYDGRLTYEHSWSPLVPLLAPQPFDQPFNVVLTQVWGGLWNAATSATPDSATMSVDWVRVWK